MREIPVSQGRVALVDDQDYPELSKYRWSLRQDNNTCYAGRYSPRTNGRQHTILMHAMIIGKPPKGMHTDHINGNGLDNRRENLRIVTPRQNGQNLHIAKASRYAGVTWYKQTQKWHARIKIGGKSKSLGYFKDELEAATTYRVACAVLCGGA